LLVTSDKLIKPSPLKFANPLANLVSCNYSY
jgi:hypothetical protein